MYIYSFYCKNKCRVREQNTWKDSYTACLGNQWCFWMILNETVLEITFYL